MTLHEIYAAHADFVWRCLRRQGVPPDDAADAVQEVFLAVHRALPSFQRRSSLPTWLFTVCRRVARDRRQRAYRRREVPSPDRLGDDVDLRADAAARLEHNARLSMLETILAAMEPDLRELFVLYEIEDMTGEEISAALSLPLGTVYSRLQLARAAFRREAARMEIASETSSVVRAGGRA
jgi:RNA polymerase sigma-70 factor (ECF subfamily)